MKSFCNESVAFFQSELFQRVQLAAIFKDSKTFADAKPKTSYADTLARYTTQKDCTTFDLVEFVSTHFELEHVRELSASQKTSDIKEHIERLWDILQKPADTQVESSLIALENPYIVPGGRFQEIYYWDSYFTAAGLIHSGKIDIVESMLNNMVSLLKRVGTIPNGNRSYYATRSQPPVMSLLVMLLAEQKADRNDFIRQYIDAIESEYQFWMQGADTLNGENTQTLRVVKMPDGSLLNRYWDNAATPRPESYREDYEMALTLPEEQRSDFYRNIRAACESGWDFSSRWLANPNDLMSVKTTAIVPVDLNCLMLQLETNLAHCFEITGNEKKQNDYITRAEQRKHAINQYLWCDEKQFYFDYDHIENKRSEVESLAVSVALFAEVASEQQTQAVANKLERAFLKSGGLVTTLSETKQQWDAPNGWAPLQWFSVQGLMNYQHNSLAIKIMQHWTQSVETIFAQTGKLMEKYNVCQVVDIASGGEYEVQEGFGWTNGVTLDFYHRLQNIAEDPK
ncbi:alpha,alpha-trehalase TreF [Pseudoalteromonas phenolica]|uniref:alpha,alpha-trehalase TreF n=1 Tax=Pseudoalteromonas phenolica TaxID=161398 RepID=UPI00110B35C9|nr:alpha,alpha-trehalase TreF [Pseudoalteromonas phenolica]TMO58021.1 alpha,alpha-trehalase [Pseudoalteromonas phenolica]